MKKNLVTINQFKGFYNLPNSRIPEEGLSYLHNAFVTNEGSIVARQGFQYFGSATYSDAKVVDSIFLSTGDAYILLKTIAPSIYFLNSSGVQVDTENINCNNILQYNDLVYIFYNSGNIKTFNITTSTLVDTGVSVQATTGLVHKTRMFLANSLGTGTLDSTLRYSDLFTLNAPNTVGGWPVNNTIDVQSSDGDPIIALSVLNDVILIFKNFSTWALYADGEPPWTLRMLHPTIGSIGRDSCVVVGGMVYFMSAQGLFRTDGTTFENLSLNDTNPALYSSGVSNSFDISAVEFKGKYIINNRNDIRVYNIENNTWTLWDCQTDALSGRILLFKQVSEPQVLTWIYGSSKRGLKYVEDIPGTGTYLDKTSSGYTVDINTKLTNFEMPGKIKTVKQVLLDFSSLLTSTVTVSVTYELNGTTMLGPYTAVLATNTAENRQILAFRGPMKCEEIMVKIQFTCTGYIELNSITYDLAVIEE